MKRGRRFWLAYSLAWVPYALSYVVIFVHQGSSLTSAISDTLINIISAAVLGLLVLWLCQRLSWSHYKRAWFFPTHVGLAVVYASLWVAMVSLIFTLWTSLQQGKLTIVYLQSFALQWEFFSGLMIYATLASLAYVQQISADLREEERRTRETELRAARAEALHTRTELTALRAKLNPHFLFNTLHTLMALVRDDRAEAEDAIERFSAMLRYLLRRQSDTGTHDVISSETSFADEWDFVQNYLALEQLRLGSRLAVETKIDPDAFDALLPPLSLQPLVENAIKHAVAPRASGGKISIAASFIDEDLVLSVSDNGYGATEDQLRQSSGLGLQLIAKTLSTQYEGRAQFAIETAPRKGFTVRLQIPQDVNGSRLLRKASAVERRAS
jgi:two-component system, LytTR family, sensor kinase